MAFCKLNNLSTVFGKRLVWGGLGKGGAWSRLVEAGLGWGSGTVRGQGLGWGPRSQAEELRVVTLPGLSLSAQHASASAC